MIEQRAMRIGIVSDLHLGGTQDSRWNNLQLQRHATEIAQAAIGLLNAQAPDLVFVTGDLTEDGYRAGDWTHQLKLARELLDGFTVPWWVVPGNHDRTLVKSGDFDRIMGEHVLPQYSRMGEFGIVALREGPAVLGNTYSSIGPAQIEQVVAAVKQDSPEFLFVFSHFPLISEEQMCARFNGKYPGHFEDGAALLEQLAGVTSRRVLVFAGHMHWHCVTENAKWIQCTTGGMIEYPVELRMLVLEANSLSFEVMGVVASELAGESLVEGGDWVRGEAKDRVDVLSLEVQNGNHGSRG